jgi:hypothetical protein
VIIASPGAQTGEVVRIRGYSSGRKGERVRRVAFCEASDSLRSRHNPEFPIRIHGDTMICNGTCPLLQEQSMFRARYVRVHHFNATSTTVKNSLWGVIGLLFLGALAGCDVAVPYVDRESIAERDPFLQWDEYRPVPTEDKPRRSVVWTAASSDRPSPHTQLPPASAVENGTEQLCGACFIEPGASDLDTDVTITFKINDGYTALLDEPIVTILGSPTGNDGSQVTLASFGPLPAIPMSGADNTITLKIPVIDIETVDQVTLSWIPRDEHFETNTSSFGPCWECVCP